MTRPRILIADDREMLLYGWPWHFIGGHEDPRQAGGRPDPKDKVDRDTWGSAVVATIGANEQGRRRC